MAITKEKTMSKIFTQEHYDRFAITKRYFKQMIKDNFFMQNWSNQYAEDNGREPLELDKTIEKAYNLLFGYKNAMPEYIKELMKKGEKFSLQTSGYRYVLKSKETVNEPHSSKIVSPEDLPVDKQNMYYANIRYYDEFTETGLQYLFLPMQEMHLIPKKNRKKIQQKFYLPKAVA